MLELLGTGGAPLRAWLRVDAGASRGAAALDESGCAILRAGPGERVHARALRVPALD